MNAILHLRIAGALLMALALSHAFFPRWFDWKTELQRLSLLNRQMLVVHSFFIALTVFLMGLLAFAGADLLQAPSALRNVVLIGMVAFWSCRLIAQLFVYDRRLWKGRPGHTAIHIGFTLLWSYLIAVFGGTLML